MVRAPRRRVAQTLWATAMARPSAQRRRPEGIATWHGENKELYNSLQISHTLIGLGCGSNETSRLDRGKLGRKKTRELLCTGSY